MAVLAAGLAGLPFDQPLGALAGMLALLTALKLREARRLGERRLVGLLQLVTVGLLAALRPELAPSLLQALAGLLAVAGLLALEMEKAPLWRVLLRRSLVVVAAALPMALALFLLVPRLAPLVPLPLQRGAAAVTGLSPSLEPGAIAELASSEAPAARVAFPSGGPPPLRERYWRVLVHDRFDGRRWSGATEEGNAPAAASGEEPTAGEPAPAGLRPSQIWLEEPSGLATVPWSGRGRPLGREVSLEPRGELRHRAASNRRRLYAVADDVREPAWRRRPPTAADLALPRGADPRLERLAAGWARGGPPRARVAEAERWFRRQPFRYSLQPGALPDRSPLDVFLFERRLGFCGHYASAFTALMRAAGVPARVVSGYRGGDWVVPVGSTGYLDLRRGDAHAWSEVWLAGEGWRRVDPTTWIAGGDLPGEAAAGGPGGGGAESGAWGLRRGGPLGWIVRQWWGLDLAWARWWLGFDGAGQEALLRRLMGERREGLGLVVLAASALGLAVGVAALGWLRGRREATDPLRRELERLLLACRRQGMAPQAGETLPAFAARLERRWPQLATELRCFVAIYQQQRFAPDLPGKGMLRRQRRRLDRRLRRLPS